MLSKASLSAETLASVLEQSVDYVTLLGLDGRILWINANGLEAMEFDSLAEVDGKPWTELWPADVAQHILAAYPRAAEGQPVRFRERCTAARGAMRWWDVTLSAVRNAAGEVAGYLATARDVTRNEADREALRVMLAEMRHRLKNSYALVSGLIYGMSRGDEAVRDFADEMAQRIRALAAAQSLFDDDEATAPLANLIEALVAPLNAAEQAAFTLDVAPQLAVGKRDADVIAVVCGELGVNSAKHGAIARGGSIGITARSDGAGLELSWTEMSDASERAPAPSCPVKGQGGQGLTLIGRIVAARGGTIAIDWRADGLQAQLALPALTA